MESKVCDTLSVAMFSVHSAFLSICSVFNLKTGKVVRLLGKGENTERFLKVAVYQGKTQGSSAIPEEMYIICDFSPHFLFYS